MKHVVVRAARGRRGAAFYGFVLLSVLTLLLAACGGNDSQTQQPTPAPASMLPLPPIGGLPPFASSLQATGALPLNMILQLTIGLKTNRQALNDDLAALYDLNSPQFGHYLTPQEIASRYGAPQSNVDQVTSFLQSQGFQVVSVSPLRNQMIVRASVAQIAQTFHVALQTFQKNGSAFFGPAGTLTLPPALRDLVTSVIGLSNFAQPSFKQSIQGQPHPALTPDARALPPQCNGEQAQGFTPSQVAAAYGYTNAYKQHYTGKGVSIGVIEFNDNASVNDLTTFLTCSTGGKLHRSIVRVDGGANDFSDDTTSEAVLDLEYLSALAPDAQLIEYQDTYCPGTDTSFACQLGQRGVSFPQGYADLLNQIVADDRVQVVSTSWGVAEEFYTKDEVFAIDQAIQLLAVEGITLAAASGDCAAFADGQFSHLAVQFPSSDPYTLAVGGTLLQTDNSGKRIVEPVWADPNPDQSQCNNTWGSTGGLSTIFPTPPWQAGAGVKNQFSNGSRELPDVSAIALNLPLYFQRRWFSSGGTSASAPIWAAGLALVDQGLQQHHKQNLGGTPTFYRLAKLKGALHPYYDVTQGNNFAYPATPGFDLATGWGAPNLIDFGKAIGAF